MSLISDLNGEQKPNQYQRTLPEIVPICTKKVMLACVRHLDRGEGGIDKIAGNRDVHDFIVVVREERDCGTLLTSTTSTTCTVIYHHNQKTNFCVCEFWKQNNEDETRNIPIR